MFAWVAALVSRYKRSVESDQSTSLLKRHYGPTKHEIQSCTDAARSGSNFEISLSQQGFERNGQEPSNLLVVGSIPTEGALS